MLFRRSIHHYLQLGLNFFILDLKRCIFVSKIKKDEKSTFNADPNFQNYHRPGTR